MNLQFKALQDETRRHILEMLRDRDLTAGEIADSFAMSAPSISYHLDLLRRAGLVSSRKQGQFVLDPGPREERKIPCCQNQN
jgi:ArsR family transcriptional regulator